MAEITLTNFGFFDYQSGDTETYEYNAEEFAKVLSMIVGTGVVSNVLMRFDASYTANTNVLTLNTGAAFVDGYWAYNSNPSSYTFNTDGTYYLNLVVDTTDRVVNIEVTTTNVGEPYTLYKVVVSGGKITGLWDLRTYVYNGSTTSSYPVYFSRTQPSVSSNAAIWLKPVNV